MSQQEIWLIRHALTLENERNVMIGHSDPPLSPKGTRAAEALAERLADQSVARLFASPLVRARTTAQFIADRHHPPLSVEESPLLREIHFGIIEGLHRTVAHEQHRALMEQALDPEREDFGFPGGEKRSDTLRRLHEFLSSLAHIQAADPIFVVTHGGLIGFALTEAYGLPLGAYRQFQPPHASITRVAVKHDGERAAQLSLIGYHPLH